MKQIFTLGHSNHTLEDFLLILEAYKIELLADVRRFPGSRKYPWFNKENFQIALTESGIHYQHFPELGGRRKINKDSLNTDWHNESFRAYADYMETKDFTDAIQVLTASSSLQRTAIMCSEVLWWRCHRSMISDYLKAQDWEVIHIFSTTHSELHPYTKVAKIKDGKLSYR